jgi:DNA polymerase-1
MARRSKAAAQQSILPGMEDDAAPPNAKPQSSDNPPDMPQRADLQSGVPQSLQPGMPQASGDQLGVPQASGLCDPPSSPAISNTIEPLVPASLVGKSVWVVDANSLIFQVFHAIPEMTSPTGQPVNAVFGYTRDMLYLLEVKKPDYLFCAFDRSEPTFRHDLYEPYKGTRSEMPTDLSPQFDFIRRMLAALQIAVVDCAGYEADDILAMIAHHTDALGGECYLVTGDKDCRQLITDRVKVFNVRKNEVYDRAALLADWGVRPDQVVDFQSLVGDSVDNIPGVPLIGPKIAREWLERFDTLDNLIERAEELPAGKRRQNLIESRDKVLLSRQLVRLAIDVPMALDWRVARVHDFDRTAAMDLCREFGFRSMRDKVQSIKLPRAGGAAAAEQSNSAVLSCPAELEEAADLQSAASIDEAAAAVSTTASHAPADEAPWIANYQTIDTPEALARLIAELSQAPLISFDTETTSIRARQAEIVGYAIAAKPGEAYYIPVRGPEGERVLDPDATLAALRPILENPAIRKLGQNLKYDMIVLRAAGVMLAGVDFDTIVASYLLEAGERNHNLDELSLRHLGHTTIKISELIGTGKQQKRMDEVPIAQVTQYAAEDSDVPLRLMPMLAQRLAADGLDPLFRDLEMPLVEVLVELEFNGIRVNVDRLAELSGRFAEKLVELEGHIYAAAGREFNIASPKQLQEILFKELHLPVMKRTKTGPSTDADVLEDLARVHPLPALIIQHRQYSKLKGTYVDALPLLVNPQTGRVHASFNQAVAATGRLSSSDPNLQNIPIRMDAGREIRSAFIPGHDGWRLLAADYSQIELRVLAHYCRDETLCASFAKDEDIHARVAAEVYGVPLDQVTAAQRRSAKAVNFGVIYGQSAFGLAKTINISQDEAAQFIDAYFRRYAGVDEFLSQTIETCARQGYVTTILGRRRAISGIRPEMARNPKRQRNLGERTAINTVIQGSAADLIKKAMLAVHRRLHRERLAAKMLLQIHDELIFEAPAEEIETLSQLVVDEMSGVMALAVPLKVDVKSGHDWAECE